MVETDGVVVDFGARQGNYPAWWKSVDIVLYGWNSAKAQVKLTGVNGQVNVHYDEAQHALHMTIPDVPGNGSLRVTQ
jgi:alpha-glucosidase